MTVYAVYVYVCVCISMTETFFSIYFVCVLVWSEV